LKLASGTVLPRPPSLRRSARTIPLSVKRSSFIESGSSNALCRGHAQITGAASIKENVALIVRISSNLPASVVIGHLEHAMDAKLTHPVGSTNTITILLMQNMNIV
jgi:hypothetical protein